MRTIPGFSSLPAGAPTGPSHPEVRAGRGARGLGGGGGPQRLVSVSSTEHGRKRGEVNADLGDGERELLVLTLIQFYL